ncbi:hypothetical protein [Gracilibacillus timonensis]|uniref:hypothetical protein n=1 Tax=Gracilibacillus timonensis TaxID=1816696 RepID=UPI000AC26DA7|nr:hypothetical protein [Gracilibacillus timonensis]
MKKVPLIFLLSIAMFLMACSEDENDSNEAEAENEAPVESETDEEEQANDAEEQPDEVDNNEGSASGIFEVTEEDQEDLTIGDTGTFQATLGTYEVTLKSAEMVGEELDGEPSLLDELIVLELSFKNIGDNVLQAEEVMGNMEITEDLMGSGFSNGASEFETIDEFEGEIQPGEERTATFIGDVLTADEYYFRKDQGNVEAGTSNQVIWTITDEEARE